MSAIAELIADRGETACGEDFFRSRPFLDAEGVTHSLRIEAGGAELAAPLVVREVPGGGGLDAISPYGYPGVAAPAGAALDPAAIDFAPTGLVTAFIRHTLGEPPLAGASERNVVLIADPALPRKQRSSDRNQVNRNRREGYLARIVGGPETSAEDRAGFLAAYEQTMRRAGAGDRYFFTSAYFGRVLESERSWLAIADAPDAPAAAASIAVESDGYLHYYLSGSLDSHLDDSPMKNVVFALVELAAERDLPLNLGGGISPGDRLEDFKRGFANREQPWHTSELICDPGKYKLLSKGHPTGSFFPAYRA